MIDNGRQRSACADGRRRTAPPMRQMPCALRAAFRNKIAAALVAAILAAPCVTPAAAQNAAPSPSRPSIEIPPVTFEREELRPAFWRFTAIKPFGAWLAYLKLEPGPAGEERRAIVVVDDRENPKTAYYLDGEKPTLVSANSGRSLRERIDWDLTHKARNPYMGPDSFSVAIASARVSRLVRIAFSLGLGDSGKFDRYPCLSIPPVVTVTEGQRQSNFSILLPERQSVFVEFDPRCRGDADSAQPPRFLFIIAAKSKFAFSDRRFAFVQGPWIVSIPYALEQSDIEKSGHLITAAALRRLLEDTAITKTATSSSIADDDAMQRTVDDGLNKLLEQNSRRR